MTFASRKLAELEVKLAGLDAEFEQWLADAEAGKRLRKHRTQLCRLTEQLRGLAARTAAELAAVAPDGDDVLRDCRRLQLRILEVHRLWDFFRTKLNLRYVEWFNPFLETVDEFAWACYKPLARGGGREAPLVYLNGEFSPFTHLRDEVFAVEDVDGALDTTDFLQIVNRLPIPLIGLPWYQVAHLPDALAIAHEVGHAAERDFTLTGTTEAHLQSVGAQLPRARRQAWFTWLPEVFADLYGVLSAGPAFVSALADLLAVSPQRVAEETAPDAPVRTHPPASLRVLVTTKALRCRGFHAEADAMSAAWDELYEIDLPFADDVDLVVETLLTGTYPQLDGKTLPDVLSFSATQHEAATVAAEWVRRHMSPPTGDVRALVAAARIAFEQDPDRYAVAEAGRPSPARLIVDRAVAAMGDETRASTAQSFVDDRAAGAALYDLMDDLQREKRP
jgi:hypothetical protein